MEIITVTSEPAAQNVPPEVLIEINFSKINTPDNKVTTHFQKSALLVI